MHRLILSSKLALTYHLNKTVIVNAFWDTYLVIKQWEANNTYFYFNFGKWNWQNLTRWIKLHGHLMRCRGNWRKLRVLKVNKLRSVVVNIKNLHQCDKKKLEKILSIYTVSVRWHPLKIYRLYIHRWNVLNLMVTTGNIYILSNTTANLKAHTWPKVNLMITNGMDSRLGRDMNLEKRGGGWLYTFSEKKTRGVIFSYIIFWEEGKTKNKHAAKNNF